MNRRGFLLGLGAALAAPAIVRFESIMPVRGIVMPVRFLPPEIYSGIIAPSHTMFDVLLEGIRGELGRYHGIQFVEQAT